MTKSRELELGYAKAKALVMLQRYPEALAAANAVLIVLAETVPNDGFTAEILRFKYSNVLREIFEPGSQQRVVGARELADCAQASDLREMWAFGEVAYLEEQCYAYSSRTKGVAPPDTERAEMVLAQIGSDLSDAVQLQYQLVTAYALESNPESGYESLHRALDLLQELSIHIRPLESIIVGSNILQSWMSANVSFGNDELLNVSVRRSLLNSPSLSSQELDCAFRAFPGDARLPAATFVIRAARLYGRFLEAENSDSSDEWIDAAKALDFWITDTVAASQNFHNAALIQCFLSEAAGHLYSLAGVPELAEARYTSSLEISKSLPEGAKVAQAIMESLCHSRSLSDPTWAAGRILSQSSPSAAWTHAIEEAERLAQKPDQELLTKAYKAFEAQALSEGVASGTVQIVEGEISDDWAILYKKQTPN